MNTTPMTQEQLDAIRRRTEKATAGPWDVEGSAYCGPLDTLAAHEDVPALLAEVERLRARAALADAMIERVARDTAAKESFTSRRPWGDIPQDERTHLRAHAHRILAADLGTGEEA